MNFLGLRLDDHDSNITYTNGTEVKYYNTERDYQSKHFAYKNLTSWVDVLKRWDLDPHEVNAIGIVFDNDKYPKLKCDHTQTYEKIEIPLFRDMGFYCPIYRIDHHYAHAKSLWPMNVDTTIDFVYDGFGDDRITRTIFKDDKRIQMGTMDDSPSFGSVLGDIGGHILKLSGWDSDMAGKVMALKAHGRLSKESIEKTKLELKTYEQCNIDGIRDLWNLPYLERLVYNSISKEGEDLKIVDHIQFCHEVTEDIFMKYFLENSTKEDVIGYSGGVALNTIINSKLRKARNIHIPPHTNDGGLSLGIVEVLREIYNEEPFETDGFPYWQDDEAPVDRPSQRTIEETCELLADGNIVGWYQGHGECGPRALGNRSILMRPDLRDGKKFINDRVKNREWFRPFGASILEENVSDYFEFEGKSEFMLYNMPTKDPNTFAPIAHVDGTCRAQTVGQDKEDFYNLLSTFKGVTGLPMVLNTSLNQGGAPVAGRINDALGILHNTDLDVLVVGDAIYSK